MGINPDLQNQINNLIREIKLDLKGKKTKKHRQGSRHWWKIVDAKKENQNYQN